MAYLLLGLFSGATVALIAIGFVFVNNVIDAYPLHLGGQVVLNAFVFYEIYEKTKQEYLALLGVVSFSVALSLLLSVAVYEPLFGRHFSSLAASIGLLIALDEIVRQGFNAGQPIPYPDSLRIKGNVNFFGTSISQNRLFVCLVAAVIAALLAAFFKWTRGGMRMRAIAESPAGARICGVNTSQSIRTAFVVSGIAAAAAAVLIGLLQSSVSADLGGTLMVGGLAAALLGGGLSLGGAVLGAIIIGVAQSLAIGYVSSTFSLAITYLIMVVILLLRPHGLFGRGREQRA